MSHTTDVGDVLVVGCGPGGILAAYAAPINMPMGKTIWIRPV